MGQMNNRTHTDRHLFLSFLHVYVFVQPEIEKHNMQVSKMHVILFIKNTSATPDFYIPKPTEFSRSPSGNTCSASCTVLNTRSFSQPPCFLFWAADITGYCQMVF